MAAGQRGTPTVPGQVPGQAGSARPAAPGQRAPARPSSPARQPSASRQPSGMSADLAGIASLAVRDLLTGPRREGRIVATCRGMAFAEFPGIDHEPRVIAICGPDTIRLPNAIIATGTAVTRSTALSPGTPPARGQDATPIADLISAATAARAVRGRPRPPVVHAGRGEVRIGDLTVQVRRWWDPSPVFGPLSRARLDHGAAVLGRLCTQGPPGPAMAGHPVAKALAACCASGDLAGAVEQAEILVGLGPGLVPAGDGLLCGMLLALRLLGGAIPGGTRAVWLAGWLSAAVTSYSWQRTTPLASALLDCAARGQAAAEVAVVLHCVAGEEQVEPAARKLLAAEGHGPGLGSADLAWGLVTGCRAAQVLSVS
ncbi:MAG TPA: DUF2877 domain-containing protein [Trebonia sp.]|nr:DUF2877 domain-containing protein [Trebonia sp.]